MMVNYYRCKKGNRIRPNGDKQEFDNNQPIIESDQELRLYAI
jgi:hypothetical protein